MNHKLRNLLIRILYTLAVFGVTLIIASRVMNRTQSAESAPMEEATFPVIRMVQGDYETDLLHGYAQEMDVASMRGPLYVAGSDRRVELMITTYGTAVTDASFEVRTVDGDNLIEQSAITRMQEEGAGRIACAFTVKDLIDYDKEQMLVVLLTTAENRTIRYYTRFICFSDEEEQYLDDHIEFVTSFHENTFTRPSAVGAFLESNSAGREDTFVETTIHSNAEAVTWDGLTVTDRTAPEIEVTDVHHRYASISLRYLLTLEEDGRQMQYHVVEDYFTRRGKQEMFLIDFHRTVDYVFTGGTEDFLGEKLELSYTAKGTVLKTSDGGNAIAFVNEGRLFVCQLPENRLTIAFGCYEAGEEDVRTAWQGTDIRVLNIDESGNTIYSVTGYINRGHFEGETGTLVCSFDAAQGAVEELLFVRSAQSEEYLTASTLHTADFVSNRGVYYLLAGNDLFAVNLYEGVVRTLAQGAGRGVYAVSPAGDIFAWQEDAEVLSERIRVIDLKTEIRREVKAEDGEKVRLVGFIGTDFIYGIVRDSDIGTDGLGNAVYPMYKVLIANPAGEILNEYESADKPVTGVSTEDARIVLHRMERTQGGTYTETDDDQIMRTTTEEEDGNHVVREETDAGIKTRIVLRRPLDGEKCRRFFAPYSVVEAHRIEVTSSGGQSARFTCADHRHLRIYSDAADAVNDAYQCYGQALDEQNRYIYYRGNQTERNQLMNLTNAVAGEDYTGMSSLEACLTVMLKEEGMSGAVSSALQKGDTPAEILAASLPDATVLNLHGCPLQAMLFYVDLMCDFPVMAQTGDAQYVLIIGFNDTELVFFNPARGTDTVYKVPISQARTLFEEEGNHFLTYIR